jgi:predicted anti-sigma-YlaC factor YlaD
MRTMRPAGRRCDRAREYASLRLDGELSELEGALLDSHLEHCPSCRAFSEDLVGLTDELRAAPLARPEFAVSLPRRRFVALRRAQLSAAAAAVVSVVGIGTLFGMLSSSATTTGRAAPRMASLAAENREFRDMRREVLKTTHPERHPGGLGVLDV